MSLLGRLIDLCGVAHIVAQKCGDKLHIGAYVRSKKTQHRRRQQQKKAKINKRTCLK